MDDIRNILITNLRITTDGRVLWVDEAVEELEKWHKQRMLQFGLFVAAPFQSGFDKEEIEEIYKLFKKGN